MSPVFGFNTDIRFGETVYHVQTEAHEAESIVQTAIFVRGRCIDKQEHSYAREAESQEFSESVVHDLLTNQHRHVVNCIREGGLESLLSEEQSATSGDVLEDVLEVGFMNPRKVSGTESQAKSVQDSVRDLRLEWLSTDSVFEADSVTLKYRLMLGTKVVEGAKIVARLEIGGIPSAYARTVSDVRGEGEVRFQISKTAQNSDRLGITVQVSYGGKSTVRRFRLSKS